MMEHILGPPGICLLAFVVAAIAVARAVLKSSDSERQLGVHIDKLDREIAAARQAIPDTEARVAHLQGLVPGFKKQYAALDRYLGELLVLDAGRREDEKEEDERRKALGTHKLRR